MMEELKRQKAQEQQLRSPNKAIQSFVKNNKQGPYNVTQDFISFPQKTQDSIGKTNINNSNNIINIVDNDSNHNDNSYSNTQPTKSPYKRDRSSNNDQYEELKMKKLEELKKELLNEEMLKQQNESENNSVSQNYNTTGKSQGLNESFPLNHQQKSFATSNTNRSRQDQNVQNSKNTENASLQQQQRLTPLYNKHENNSQRTVKHEGQRTQRTTQNKKDVSQTRNQPQVPSTRSQKSFQQTKKTNNTDISQASTPKQSQQSVQSSQLSEKTQQIYFKRLQKDVEQAIRQSDTLEKGGLDIEEFKQCFYNLEYLPFMQNELRDERSYRTTNDYNYQNTLRNLIIQEKEFVYNLWSVLNPLNNNFIENALVYDVLLLLIYNVKSPITTTSNFLEEYLENFYKEENIDLDSFANYNSGSSLGIKLSGQSFDGNDTSQIPLSNLDKYLSYNNLWSVEKIAIEFKQIHANKVSNMFSTKQRSTSPKIVSTQYGVQFVNHDDGRRYKKGIIEDHLSQLTFSPFINEKTKQLDQQLTQRLLQETQPVYRRDVSADNIMRKDQNSYLQEQDQNANPKRYELLYYRQHLKEQKIEKAKENMINKELEECTFHPQTTQNSKSYTNLQKQADQIFRDLTEKIKTQKMKLDQTANNNNRTERELEECTFKPQINNNPKKTIPKDQVPKGYYEMINRIRKVNDEKKALEEKQHKKAIGQNYDKLKLMNLKPPSFVDKERNKRKILMYVDINITPTKTGRIGIYEGDDVRDLAKNFKKAFQLNNNMYHLLTLQLEQHLKAYKEQHGFKNDNGTVFPIKRDVSNDRSQTRSGAQTSQDFTGLQVAQELSHEYSNEDEEDERDIRHRIIGFNQQRQQMYRQQTESPDFNDTQQINDFVKQEIERFDNLEREQKQQRDIYNAKSGIREQERQYINYDDSFRGRY